MKRRNFIAGLALFLGSFKLPSLSLAQAGRSDSLDLTDFGGLIVRRAKGLMASLEDAIALLKKGETVHPRGTGHSCMGMGLKNNAWIFTPPKQPLYFNEKTEIVTVSAGTTLFEADQFLSSFHYMLPVSPDYRALSIGGVLSVGGYGIESIRRGSLVNHVISFDLLTPQGTIETAVPGHSVLGKKVLGGLGRYGTILSAQMRCHKKPVRSYIRRLEFTHYDSYVQALLDHAPIKNEAAPYDLSYSFWQNDGHSRQGTGSLILGYFSYKENETVSAGYQAVPDIRALRHNMVSQWVYKPDNAYYVWSDHFIPLTQYKKQADDTLDAMNAIKNLNADVVLYSCFLAPSATALDTTTLSMGVYANFDKAHKKQAYQAATHQIDHSERAQRRGAIPYKYGWYKDIS